MGFVRKSRKVEGVYLRNWWNERKLEKRDQQQVHDVWDNEWMFILNVFLPFLACLCFVILETKQANSLPILLPSFSFSDLWRIPERSASHESKIDPVWQNSHPVYPNTIINLTKMCHVSSLNILVLFLSLIVKGS